MGRDRTTTVQQTTPEATPEQRELINLQLQQARRFDPIQQRTTELQSDVISALLGGQALPGELGNLVGGINEERAQDIADQAVRGLPALFQRSGILNSGVAADITARTSADILADVEQFNLQNKGNLLALALGGGTSFQQPFVSSAGQLSNTLRGLQPITSSQTVSAPNPFISSFQRSLGRNLGGFGLQNTAGTFGTGGRF